MLRIGSSQYYILRVMIFLQLFDDNSCDNNNNKKRKMKKECRHMM